VGGGSSLLPSRYPEGTFGYAVLASGLSFSELSEGTGLAHTTLMRWAWAGEEGRGVVLRYPRETVDIVFMRLNAAAQANYTPSQFGLRWPASGGAAKPASLGNARTDRLVLEAYSRMMARVVACRTPKEKYQAIAALGKRARSAVDRVAWGRAWRTVCASLFLGDRNAHLQPPRLCEWYTS
jgi:hypothetical protein